MRWQINHYPALNLLVNLPPHLDVPPVNHWKITGKRFLYPLTFSHDTILMACIPWDMYLLNLFKIFQRTLRQSLEMLCS